MPTDFPCNEFDAYAEEEDDPLEQGLSVSGERRD
jgi:hypothetical protein